MTLQIKQHITIQKILSQMKAGPQNPKTPKSPAYKSLSQASYPSPSTQSMEPIQVPITIQSNFSKKPPIQRQISFDSSCNFQCISDTSGAARFRENQRGRQEGKVQYGSFNGTSNGGLVSMSKCTCQCEEKISIINDQIVKLGSWIGLIFKLIQIVQDKNQPLNEHKNNKDQNNAHKKQKQSQPQTIPNKQQPLNKKQQNIENNQKQLEQELQEQQQQTQQQKLPEFGSSQIRQFQVPLDSHYERLKQDQQSSPPKQLNQMHKQQFGQNKRKTSCQQSLLLDGLDNQSSRIALAGIGISLNNQPIPADTISQPNHTRIKILFGNYTYQINSIGRQVGLLTKRIDTIESRLSRIESGAAQVQESEFGKIKGNISMLTKIAQIMQQKLQTNDQNIRKIAKIINTTFANIPPKCTSGLNLITTSLDNSNQTNIDNYTHNLQDWDDTNRQSNISNSNNSIFNNLNVEKYVYEDDANERVKERDKNRDRLKEKQKQRERNSNMRDRDTKDTYHTNVNTNHNDNINILQDYKPRNSYPAKKTPTKQNTKNSYQTNLDQILSKISRLKHGQTPTPNSSKLARKQDKR